MRRINFGAPGAPLTKAKALAWEEVRTAGAIAGAWTLVCIAYAFQYQLTMGEAGWRREDELLTSVMYFAPALLALLLVLNPNNAGHLAGGFPQRVLRLPISVRMAAPIALFGRALLVFASTALILGVNRLLFEGAPALSLALSYVLFYLIAQTVDWLRAPISGLTSLLGVAALITLTAAWGHWEHVGPWLHALREPGWATGLVAVALAAALGYGVSVLAVGATRTGRRVGIPEIWEWPERFSFRRAPNLAPFSSPLAAQTWFELRRVGWVMPLTAIGLWVLASLITWLYGAVEEFGLAVSLYAFLMIGIAAFAHAPASAIIGFRFVPGAPGFEYMRPLTSADYARAKMRANIILLAPLVLAALVLFLAVNGGAYYFQMLAHTVAEGALSTKEAVWAVTSRGIGLALLVCFLMALGTRLLRWLASVLILSAIILAGVRLLTSPTSNVPLDEALLGEPLTTAAIWGVKLAFFVLVFATYDLAWGKHLMSTRALAWGLGVWVGAAWMVRGALTQPLAELPGTLFLPGYGGEALACLFFASLIVLPYPAILFDINRRRHGAAVEQDPRQHECLRKDESAPGRRFGTWAMAGAAAVLVVWLGGPGEPAYRAYLREQNAPATWEDLRTYYEVIPQEKNVAVDYITSSGGSRQDVLGMLADKLKEANPGLNWHEVRTRARESLDDYLYIVGNRRIEPGEPLDETAWALTETYWENTTSPLAEELKRIAEDGRRPARYFMLYFRPEHVEVISAIYTSELTSLRDKGQELHLDALYWSKKGEPARAVEACLAILPLAESLAEEPILSAQLTRFAILGRAVATLETVLDRASLTEADLRRLQDGFAEIEAPYQQDWMMRHGLMGERVLALEGHYLWDEPNDENVSALVDLREIVEKLVMPPVNERMVVLHFYSKVLDDAAEDFPRDGRELRELQESFQGMPLAMGGLANVHVDTTVRTFDSEWRARIRLRLAQTAAAVERFRLEHDRWPEDLSELVPEYLDEVPRDLFCLDGEPLRYVVRPDGSRRIYSVGRNHRDDGGLTHRLDEQGADIVFVLEAGSHE